MLTVGKEMQRILLIGSRRLFYLNFRTLLSKPLGKKFACRNQMLLPTELVMIGTQCYVSKIKICRTKFSKAGSRQWSNSHCNYTAHWSWASNGVHLISWYRYKRKAKCLICPSWQYLYSTNYICDGNEFKSNRKHRKYAQAQSKQ